jgi:membrane protein YqaA with SNARE-associated domain
LERSISKFMGELDTSTTERDTTATHNQREADLTCGKANTRGASVISSALRWPRNTLRGLYEWTMHWSRTPKAPYALFAIAFIESSFFPIPPDALLIPMVASRREKWFRYAFICTIGSVIGALMGYLIGWAFYESVGKRVVEMYNLQQTMELVGLKYSQNAFLTVFTAAFTPIPFKVITIGAGLFHIPISTLVVGSVIGRAGRFFLVAGLLRIFGAKMSGFIEKNFDRLSLAFAALLIGGFVALKYLA